MTDVYLPPGGEIVIKAEQTAEQPKLTLKTALRVMYGKVVTIYFLSAQTSSAKDTPMPWIFGPAQAGSAEKYLMRTTFPAITGEALLGLPVGRIHPRSGHKCDYGYMSESVEPGLAIEVLLPPAKKDKDTQE